MSTPSPTLVAKFEAEGKLLLDQAAKASAEADNLEARSTEIADDIHAAEKRLAEAEAAVQRLRVDVNGGRERYQQAQQQALQHRQAAAAMRADAQYLAETIVRVVPVGVTTPGADDTPEPPPEAFNVAAARQQLDAQAGTEQSELNVCARCSGSIAKGLTGAWVHTISGHPECLPGDPDSSYAEPADLEAPPPGQGDAPFRADEAAE